MAVDDPHDVATRAPYDDAERGTTTSLRKDVVPEMPIAEMASQQPPRSTTQGREQKAKQDRTVAREEQLDYEHQINSTVPGAASATPKK